MILPSGEEVESCYGYDLHKITSGRIYVGTEKIQKAFIPASCFLGGLPVQLSFRFHISPGHGQRIALGPDFGKSQTMDN